MACFGIFAVLMMVSFGVCYGCVTPENTQQVNDLAQGIIDQAVSSGLATQNQQTNQLEFPPENIAPILGLLCSSDGQGVLTQIETLLENCRQLAVDSTKLHLLRINGVGFTQLVSVFQGVSHFCECSSDLPNAWALKSDTTTKVHMDPTAYYTDIANVGNLCGDPLKTQFTNVGSADANCLTALKNQAGVAKFDEYYNIAKDCSDSTDTDWTCMKGVAKSSNFKECLTEADNKVGDEALCGKYECVSKKMSTCTTSARSMYIKAVNIENPDSIPEDDAKCGASALKISLLMSAICLFLLFVNYLD